MSFPNNSYANAARRALKAPTANPTPPATPDPARSVHRAHAGVGPGSPFGPSGPRTIAPQHGGFPQGYGDPAEPATPLTSNGVGHAAPRGKAASASTPRTPGNTNPTPPATPQSTRPGNRGPTMGGARTGRSDAAGPAGKTASIGSHSGVGQVPVKRSNEGVVGVGALSALQTVEPARSNHQTMPKRSASATGNTPKQACIQSSAHHASRDNDKSTKRKRRPDVSKTSEAISDEELTSAESELDHGAQIDRSDPAYRGASGRNRVQASPIIKTRSARAAELRQSKQASAPASSTVYPIRSPPTSPSNSTRRAVARTSVVGPLTSVKSAPKRGRKPQASAAVYDDSNHGAADALSTEDHHLFPKNAR
ncbi:hypothetical protein EST38_g14078 [Candolleomyces aberdarensis]|uniref:Uncharacterized protein n=1 Tax=Candolleomyces aberdarensis TaxID=2316362 RepID=A0A4Q2CY78_9AGAR|nr:hypothetical protein EST38_g14078 [Candolleomyces aberdarensis]